jgi:hypothetical protein
MKNFILILSICCTSQIVFCQENSDSTIITSSKIIKDNRIDALGETYKSTYKLIGFRVQIHSGNKRQPANQARASFSRVHPKTKAHLDYEQPYYKVRVGDFKTKLEALKYKNFIAKEFPNSFIVKDEIDISEFSE